MFADERDRKTILYRVAGTDIPMEFIPVPGVREGDLLILISTPVGENALCEWWPGHGIPDGIRIEARKPVIPYRVKR